MEELADTIDTEVPEAKNIELDINEKETEMTAYNIPVDNLFKTLAMNHFVTNENKTDDANDVFEVDLGETVEKKNDSGDKYKVFDEAFLKAFQDCLQKSFPSTYTEEVMLGLNQDLKAAHSLNL